MHKLMHVYEHGSPVWLCHCPSAPQVKVVPPTVAKPTLQNTLHWSPCLWLAQIVESVSVFFDSRLVGS